MERIERGWAGHFCLGPDCQWHRNTLVKNDDGRMIVVSSVGCLVKRSHYGKREGFDEIGLKRWYETMAFVAHVDGDYIEADIHKQIYTYDGQWQIDREPDGKTDLEAEKMHEDFVAFVMEHFDECYADGENYGRDV